MFLDTMIKQPTTFFFEAEYEVNDAFIVEFEIDYLRRSFDNNVIDSSGIDEPTRSKEAWTCSRI